MTTEQRQSIAEEALELVADSMSGLPRLASLLVSLDHDQAATRVLTLQAELLGVLRPSRKSRTKQK